MNGNWDFIISSSSELLILNSLAITIVDAKKDNINADLGQCVAEMLAAKIFNEKEGNDIPIIYGTVTTGTSWKFLKLIENIVEIDLNEYYIDNVGKIFGILCNILSEKTI